MAPADVFALSSRVWIDLLFCAEISTARDLAA